MTARLPLVIIGGVTQQLPSGDTVTGATAGDPVVNAYAPGAFSLAAGQFTQRVKRLTLTGSQRATLAGDSCLRID